MTETARRVPTGPTRPTAGGRAALWCAGAGGGKSTFAAAEAAARAQSGPVRLFAADGPGAAALSAQAPPGVRVETPAGAALRLLSDESAAAGLPARLALASPGEVERLRRRGARAALQRLVHREHDEPTRALVDWAAGALMEGGPYGIVDGLVDLIARMEEAGIEAHDLAAEEPVHEARRAEAMREEASLRMAVVGFVTDGAVPGGSGWEDDAMRRLSAALAACPSVPAAEFPNAALIAAHVRIRDALEAFGAHNGLSTTGRNRRRQLLERENRLVAGLLDLAGGPLREAVRALLRETEVELSSYMRATGRISEARAVRLAARLLHDAPQVRARAAARTTAIVVDDADRLSAPALNLVFGLAGDDPGRVVLVADAAACRADGGAHGPSPFDAVRARTAPARPLPGGPTAGASLVALARALGSNAPTPADDEPGTVELLSLPRAHQRVPAAVREAPVVADRIERVRSAPDAPRAVAVLTVDAAAARAFAGTLAARGIACVVESTAGLDRDAADLWALARTLVAPHDRLALVATLRGPLYAVPDAELWWLDAFVGPDDAPVDAPPPAEAAAHAPVLAAAVADIAALRAAARRAPALDVALERVAAGGGLDVTAQLHRGHERVMRARARAFALDARSAGLEDDVRLPFSADAVTDADAASPVAVPDGAVYVGTVAGARGRRFDWVILCDLDAARARPRFPMIELLRGPDGRYGLGLKHHDPESDTFQPDARWLHGHEQRFDRESAAFDRRLEGAVTRARKMLTIVAQESFRNDRVGWSPRLRAALDALGVTPTETDAPTAERRERRERTAAPVHGTPLRRPPAAAVGVANGCVRRAWLDGGARGFAPLAGPLPLSRCRADACPHTARCHDETASAAHLPAAPGA